MWKKGQKVGLFELVVQKVEVVIEKIRQKPVHMQQVGDMCLHNVVDYQQFEWVHATIHEKTHGRLHEMVQ